MEPRRVVRGRRRALAAATSGRLRTAFAPVAQQPVHADRARTGRRRDHHFAGERRGDDDRVGRQRTRHRKAHEGAARHAERGEAAEDAVAGAVAEAAERVLVERVVAVGQHDDGRLCGGDGEQRGQAGEGEDDGAQDRWHGLRFARRRAADVQPRSRCGQESRWRAGAATFASGSERARRRAPDGAPRRPALAARRTRHAARAAVAQRSSQRTPAPGLRLRMRAGSAAGAPSMLRRMSSLTRPSR